MTDPASLNDMKASRNPSEIHEWLDNKIEQGFDQKVIKVMLRMSSEELSEVYKGIIDSIQELILLLDHSRSYRDTI